MGMKFGSFLVQGGAVALGVWLGFKFFWGKKK